MIDYFLLMLILFIIFIIVEYNSAYLFSTKQFIFSFLVAVAGVINLLIKIDIVGYLQLAISLVILWSALYYKGYGR